MEQTKNTPTENHRFTNWLGFEYQADTVTPEEFDQLETTPAQGNPMTGEGRPVFITPAWTEAGQPIHGYLVVVAPETVYSLTEAEAKLVRQALNRFAMTAYAPKDDQAYDLAERIAEVLR